MSAGDLCHEDHDSRPRRHRPLYCDRRIEPLLLRGQKVCPTPPATIALTMGMRKSKRLALELARDPSVGLGERHTSGHVLRHLCEKADEQTTSGDRDTLRVARLTVRIAGRLLRLQRWRRRPAESAELAVSFARLANALRLAGRYNHAQRAMEIALEAAPSYLRGDLHRRQAWLRMYQGRLSEAVQEAELAVALTADQDHALALGTLGVALDYSGNHRGAARKLGRCLARLDPESEYRYCSALVSYALVLSKGSAEDTTRALNLCAQIRSRFKVRHKMQRAKTWWLEGLLHTKLGDHPAAWRALDTSRRSLIALKAAPEVAAVVADMALVSGQLPAVRHICNEAAEVIVDPHPLRKPLDVLAGATREMIPESAAALRQAAVVLAPCPAL